MNIFCKLHISSYKAFQVLPKLLIHHHKKASCPAAKYITAARLNLSDIAGPDGVRETPGHGGGGGSTDVTLVRGDH